MGAPQRTANEYSGSYRRVPEFPDSDGQPMADNTLQLAWIMMMITGIRALFADRQHEVFVAGDLLWYPDNTNPNDRLAPDVLVVFGRPQHHRGSYRQWEENGIAPQVVVEVLSPNNTRKEMNSKREWYERHGVLEYVEIDPDRNEATVWEREDTATELARVPTVETWQSPHTGIRFVREGLHLRVIGPDGLLFTETHNYLTEIKQGRERFREQYEARLAAEKTAEAAEQTAAAERERAQAERERAERMAAKLRELGLDPDTLEPGNP